MAMKSKHIAENVQERILVHLKDSEKKELLALNIIAGTHIDKMKLLQGKPTQVSSVASAQLSVKELDMQLGLVGAKLKEFYCEEEGNNPEIIEVDGEEIPTKQASYQ